MSGSNYSLAYDNCLITINLQSFEAIEDKMISKLRVKKTLRQKHISA